MKNLAFIKQPKNQCMCQAMRVTNRVHNNLVGANVDIETVCSKQHSIGWFTKALYGDL